MTGGDHPVILVILGAPKTPRHDRDGHKSLTTHPQDILKNKPPNLSNQNIEQDMWINLNNDPFNLNNGGFILKIFSRFRSQLLRIC